MRKNQYSQTGKMNKARLAVCIMLLCWLLFKESTPKEDIFFEATSQMVPLLTYEKEYGNLNIDYATTYDVPDWFYEDESELPVNGDIAMLEESDSQDSAKTQTEGMEQKGSESITTLADGGKGTTFTRQQLESPDFLLSKIFVVDTNTSMTDEELNISNLLDRDLTVDNLKKDVSPKILIYHTHASEAFADSREGYPEDTIVGVGAYLKEILEKQYGIAVYHDTTTYDMIDGVLDRSKAYENSYNGVSKILKENPTIEVVIDLHRDGVDEETHLVTEINGKKTAKIMFLNGVSRSDTNGEIAYLENPNKDTNLAFSFQMYLTGKEHYGDYVRKIYVRSLRYNLHVMPRAALIEVGAQNNTIQEEKNAMEPLAAILDKVLSKKE
ncbi:MAG: stage II sporulation protein P [Lachnospiraceae bacterium]|nr:stage II sporulation protein P [Lachnospiraceae bacterium]